MTSTRPPAGTYATELYEAVRPLAPDDAAYGWPLLHYMVALAQMFQDVADLARDTAAGEEGWSLLLDVDRSPTKALPWLAQFVGVTLPAVYTSEQARNLIRNTGGYRRGSPAAIIGVVAPFLTGNQTVTINEKDTGPGHATVITYADETAINAGTIGNPVPGTSWLGPLPADRKFATQYTATEQSPVDEIYAYMSNAGGGAQPVKGCVWADTGANLPGALLGVSAPVTLSAGQAERWLKFRLPQAVNVTAGQKVWVGGQCGPTSGGSLYIVTRAPGNGTGRHRDADGYATPAATFGTGTADTLEHSVYAGYSALRTAIKAAILAQKPAGLTIDYETRTGQSYAQLLRNYPTFADVKADYADYQSVSDNVPH